VSWVSFPGGPAILESPRLAFGRKALSKPPRGIQRQAEADAAEGIGADDTRVRQGSRGGHAHGRHFRAATRQDDAVDSLGRNAGRGQGLCKAGLDLADEIARGILEGDP